MGMYHVHTEQDVSSSDASDVPKMITSNLSLEAEVCRGLPFPLQANWNMAGSFHISSLFINHPITWKFMFSVTDTVVK
jgi:hypothetical protein